MIECTRLKPIRSLHINEPPSLPPLDTKPAGFQAAVLSKYHPVLKLSAPLVCSNDTVDVRRCCKLHVLFLFYLAGGALYNYGVLRRKRRVLGGKGDLSPQV
ncbi:hypothetical protein LDENG_00080380 [Lucifuga dentata]|nr:hypothetical protein LDENG_00080380 [Lucifuga dentata]